MFLKSEIFLPRSLRQSMAWPVPSFSSWVILYHSTWSPAFSSYTCMSSMGAFAPVPPSTSKIFPLFISVCPLPCLTHRNMNKMCWN
jgi:hypothetical protein